MECHHLRQVLNFLAYGQAILLYKPDYKSTEHACDRQYDMYNL